MTHRGGGNANALRGTETLGNGCAATRSDVAETPMPYGALKQKRALRTPSQQEVAETPMPYGALKHNARYVTIGYP